MDEEGKTAVVNSILSVESSNVRLPQRPDASADEKRTYLFDLLNRDPSLVLEKFGQNLSSKELSRFDVYRDSKYSFSYEVRYYLEELLPSPSRISANHDRQKITRNRRLTFLNKELLNTDYFSETAMQERDPILYEDMFHKLPKPQNMTEELKSYTTNPIVRHMFDCLDIMHSEELLKSAKEMEEEEEEDSEIEEEMSSDIENSNTPEQLQELDIQQILPEDDTVVKDVLTDGQDIAVECTTIPPPQDPVTEALLEEFKGIMIERWLYGKDTTFDYSQVDDDPTLDDLEQIGRDVQDNYFDEQEPSNMNTGTGIQDF